MSKFIVVSDLHLGLRGEEYSLLGVQANPGGVLNPAAAKLKKITEDFADQGASSLIIVGDAVDLAMADHDAIDEDVDFLRGLLPSLADIYVVAGNHDHHLFTLVQENGAEHAHLHVCYPDLFLEGGSPLYFIHGDIFDSPTDIVPRFLLAPEVVGRDYAELAASASAPLTELIWWSLGEMGGAYGRDGLVAELYNDLRRGDDARVKATMRAGLERMGYNAVEVAVGASILTRLLGDAVGKAHTGKADARHQDTEASRAGLRAWLERTQYDTAKRGYVFTGHSHVADLFSVGNCNCYNLGSWMVELGHPVPDAMVALVDTSKEPAVVGWEKCTA